MIVRGMSEAGRNAGRLRLRGLSIGVSALAMVCAAQPALAQDTTTPTKPVTDGSQGTTSGTPAVDAGTAATAQGQAGAAHKGLEHVAKVMAGTAADLFARPEVVAAARAEHAARTAEAPSVFPIPKDVAPPFDMAKGH